MKAKLFILFVLVISMLSCDNDVENIEGNVNGDYVGIFERNGNTSKVELTLDSGTFNGESEVRKFPALCNGTYTISRNLLTFTNECPWTAEFDWTLILSGEWTFDMNNNVLIMTKTNGDKYTLTQK